MLVRPLGRVRWCRTRPQGCPELTSGAGRAGGMSKAMPGFPSPCSAQPCCGSHPQAICLCSPGGQSGHPSPCFTLPRPFRLAVFSLGAGLATAQALGECDCLLCPLLPGAPFPEQGGSGSTSVCLGHVPGPKACTWGAGREQVPPTHPLWLGATTERGNA